MTEDEIKEAFKKDLGKLNQDGATIKQNQHRIITLQDIISRQGNLILFNFAVVSGGFVVQFFWRDTRVHLIYSIFQLVLFLFILSRITVFNKVRKQLRHEEQNV